MHHLHFNHLALLVSALMQWLIGAVWYSLLFVKPWKAAAGYVAERPKGERPKGAVFAMATSFVVSLILSFMLLHVILWSGADSILSGAFVGLICWVGFIAGPMLAQTLYEQRPKPLLLINWGYWLVVSLLSGSLLAVWK